MTALTIVRFALGERWRELRRFVDRWLFRLGGPESAPIVLVQRRIFVLPTRAGIAFAVTLLLMLIGSINYVLSLGYALTFLLAGLGVVSILHTFRNLARLRIEPGRCDPVFAGAPAVFPLALINEAPEPRLELRLKLRDGDALPASVGGNASQIVMLPQATRKRGWQRPGRVTVETTFPLGLVRAWSYFEPDMRCLVYPVPERNPPALDVTDARTDGDRAAASGAEDFAGLRDHQAADSPRHVAWKAVARGGPLVTKQFAGGGGATIWLDWDRLPSRLDPEARLSRLAAHVLQLQATGAAFGLRLPGNTLSPQIGPLHVEACLMALALHGEQHG